jgi:hypothetical protein
VKDWKDRTAHKRFADGTTHIADIFKNLPRTTKNIDRKKKRLGDEFLELNNRDENPISMETFAAMKGIPYGTIRTWFKSIGIRSKLRGHVPYHLQLNHRIARMAFCYIWSILPLENFLFFDEFNIKTNESASTWSEPRWCYKERSAREMKKPLLRTKFEGKRVDFGLGFTLNEKVPLMSFGDVRLTKRRPFHDIFEACTTELTGWIPKVLEPITAFLNHGMRFSLFYFIFFFFKFFF